MSAAKQKGTAWETAISGYLTTHTGTPIRRIAQTGARDVGDIHLGPICIEAKNHKQMALADWVDQAEEEATNAGLPIGVVWHHRPRKASPADGYVTMSGETFLRLLHMIGADLTAAFIDY